MPPSSQLITFSLTTTLTDTNALNSTTHNNNTTPHHFPFFFAFFIKDTFFLSFLPFFSLSNKNTFFGRTE